MIHCQLGGGAILPDRLCRCPYSVKDILCCAMSPPETAFSSPMLMVLSLPGAICGSMVGLLPCGGLGRGRIGGTLLGVSLGGAIVS